MVKNKGRAAIPSGHVRDPVRRGVSREGEIIELGVAQGLIEIRCLVQPWRQSHIRKGRTCAISCGENPEIARNLETQIRAT